MKNIINKISFIAILLIAISTSCEKDATITPSQGNDVEYVTCSLTLNVESIVGSEITTKGTNMDDIDDLWIIQLDANNKVVGFPTYVSDVNAADALSSITLVSTAGKELPIIYIANTDNANLEIGNGWTLEQIKALRSDSYSYEKNSRTYYPMSTKDSKVVSANKPLSCNLKFNFAKVDITINNEIPSELKLLSAQLCSVAKSVNYFMDYTPAAPFPTVRDHENRTQVTISDANQEVFTINGLYLPTNMQGSCADKNGLQANKPIYASENSTYLLVKAQTTQSGVASKSLEYRFYLGENLVADYNIKPNKYYNYTITLDDIGSIENDARITVVGTSDLGYESIDYTTRRPANCYIINPSSSEQRLYIPVIERINEFWGNKGYENDPEKVIGTANDTWSAEYIMRDNTIAISNSNQTASSNSIQLIAMETAPSGRKSLCVKVPENFSGRGNFTVMIKKDGLKLWSWHFWVTDYNPYDAPNYIDDYHFKVTGGQVHRYSGKIWKNGGAYEGKYIMDRPLGASSDDADQTLLYYQYGRKDPMIATGSKTSAYTFGSGYAKGSLKAHWDNVTITKSVEFPDKFITADGYSKYAWLLAGNQYTDLSKTVWNDPMLTVTSAAAEVKGKSIFDPSPVGWKVPGLMTWESFSRVYQLWDGTKYTFTQNGENIVYYPTGYINYVNTYKSPTIADETSTPQHKINSGYYWSYSPFGATNGHEYFRSNALRFYQNYVACDGDFYKANAYPIICVQE